MKTFAILLAAGSSQRAGQNKLLFELAGQALWRQSYETLCAHPEIDEVILVGPEGIPGGETWMQSFQAGLKAAHAQVNDLVLVHNAANPYVTTEEISATLSAAKQHGAAAVSHPAVDTLMLAKNGIYDGHVDRRLVRHMQTPQAARAELLTDLPESTDLISALPIPAAMVDASPQNRKITTMADFALRTFIGEDSHRFSKAGALTLGGLTLSDFPSMQANSDGDVILHAIGRALAQAQNVSFSEVADQLCEEGQKNSSHYLAPLLKGLKIHNLSLMLEGTRPKIDPIKADLKYSLAEILQILPSQISIAASTGEDLSDFGRGEGLRCICLLSCL